MKYPSALFVPCTIDGYDKHTGSALIRARWVAKYWPGALVFDGRQPRTGWDIVIFQKAYQTSPMRRLLSRFLEARSTGEGPLLALDLCDPDFLNATQRRALLDVLPYFDFAVAPTQPLADWLGQWLPAYVVPDTFDPEVLTQYRGFDWKGRPHLVWIGYHSNRTALSDVILDTVGRHALHLDIIDLDRPMPFDEWLNVVTQYDVLLNPRPDWGRFRYKSNNKSVIAWASGVAVAESAADVESLANPEWHLEWITLRLRELRLGQYHAPYAVAAWQDVLCTYKEFNDAHFGSESS